MELRKTLASLDEKFWLTIRALSEPAAPWALMAAGSVILAGLYVLQNWTETSANAAISSASAVGESRKRLSETLGEYHSLTDLRSHDIAQLQTDLSRLTQSRRAMFESNFDIQAEQRLLEKQWEIMSTYLMIDEQAKKIHLMRGEQALETYPITIAPPRVVGGETKRLPNIVRIVSKERFAHPERGTYEEVNGQLVWNPPQVGTSVRANALGEFVTFTDSPLILHGPPKQPLEHEAFPHYCLDLSLATAKKLYKNTFIGTKIIVKSSPDQRDSTPPPQKASSLPVSIKITP